jgi:hypothetical protein
VNHDVPGDVSLSIDGSPIGTVTNLQNTFVTSGMSIVSFGATAGSIFTKKIEAHYDEIVVSSMPIGCP